MVDEALKALGTAPISADTPAGESARYEPEFERIEAEVAKLESVSQVEVDWKAVVADATAILKGKSKDLLVAAFLCRGLFATEGYAGLAAGLGILKDLVEGFWDNLHPPRPRARGAAATWAAEKVAPAVAARPPGPSEGEAVAEAQAALEALDTLLTEKLADQAPALGDLRRALKEHARSAQSAAQPAAPAQAVPTAAAAAQGAALPTTIASDGDLTKAIKACQETLRAMAAYQRGKDAGDPAAYLTQRYAAWLAIRQPPPDTDGTTQIREPAADRLEVLSTLLEKGGWAELVEQAEASIARLPFWIDAHRYTAMGLQGLGHEEAALAVREALRLFLTRFPTLRGLRFAGGAPFADEATSLWLDAEVMGGGAAAGEAAPAGPEVPPWTETLKKAKAKAARKKVGEGLALFDQGVKDAATGRDRFHWEINRARFCLDAGHAQVAAHMLESLDDTVERHGLETWEPALAVEVAKILLLCYKGLPKPKEMGAERRERVERLESRLSRLDVRAALDLPEK